MPVSDEVATVLLDSFGRASEDPISQGGAWAEVLSWAAGPMRLVNPFVTSDPAAPAFFIPAASYRTDISMPAGDGEAWGYVGRASASNEPIGLLLHVIDPDTALDGYLGSVGNRIGNDWLIHRFDNGTPTLIAQGGGTFPATDVDDVVLFRRVGNDLQLLGYDSATDTWTTQLTVTDTNYTGGSIGMMGESNDGEAYWRGFGGGAPRDFLPQIIRYR